MLSLVVMVMMVTMGVSTLRLIFHAVLLDFFHGFTVSMCIVFSTVRLMVLIGARESIVCLKLSLTAFQELSTRIVHLRCE